MSMINATGCGPAGAMRKRPTSRASINPRKRSGASAQSLPFTAQRHVRSSATNSAPRDISSSARADLPLPDDPRITAARPFSATQLACKISVSSSLGLAGRWSGIARHADHTGRPTTKRAPSGSEVASASVGRMFSAQITPSWASTICLEIDKPRPELLPKSLSERCE